MLSEAIPPVKWTIRPVNYSSQAIISCRFLTWLSPCEEKQQSTSKTLTWNLTKAQINPGFNKLEMKDKKIFV